MLVGRTGEHHQEEEVQEEEQELLQQAEDEEVQAEPPAALSTDQEEGIATNIKVKEVWLHHNAMDTYIHKLHNGHIYT